VGPDSPQAGKALTGFAGALDDRNTSHFAGTAAAVPARLGGRYARIDQGLAAVRAGDADRFQTAADALRVDTTAWGMSEEGLAPSGPTPFSNPFLGKSGDGPEMLWLRGGTFRMGGPEGVGQDNEHPADSLTLSH